MKKNTPRNKRSLTRPELLGRHRRREYQDTKNELNEFSRRALAGLKYHPEGEALETTLNQLDRRMSSSSQPVFSIRNMLSIAATALLLLAAGYFIFYQPHGNRQLFAQHFEYLPSAVQTESGERNLPSAYEEEGALRLRAMQAYEAGQYQRSRNLMEQHLSAFGRDMEIRFYLGIVLLGEGETEAAINHFKAVRDNLPRPAYERPVKWYLALAFLSEGIDEQAEKLLLNLEEGKDRYASGARDLLRQL